ncbi:fibronectin type III domain-containing protein, partial [candidate division WOR-3 bacterium]|nr:fibronectin type III domain-containing protein [candidate division WOR-3 bacterium]
ISLVGVPQAAHFVRYQGRMASLYTPLAHRVSFRSFPSDSRSFDNQGYAATSGYEYGSEPYIWYHTTGDTLGNCNMDLAADVTRMAVATLMSLGLAPLAPERFTLVDAGSGTSLVASWSASTEPDLAGYKLLWGRARRNYSDSVMLGRVTAHRITGLLTDTTYYASVVAIDSAGHESGASPEDSAVPGTVPRPPTNLAAMPFRHGMALNWTPNTEIDLAGYNLYRRTAGSGYQRLNQTLLTDTTHRDSGLCSDTMYRYFCTAVDSSGYESDSSRAARGKPVSLDHGILLVDETRDGTGQPGNPSDEQQDRFYHALLAGRSFRDWDVARDSLPLAGDIGPYSTVVWHGDDYTQQEIRPALPGLANYLQYGGRLWLVGWKPVAALMASNAYPFAFQPGQFPYDFLHLSRAEQSARPDFIGATGLLGYPDVTVESAKATPSLRGRLPYIDALLPRDAEAVLAYNSFSGDTFHGKPVGIRRLAEPGRAVFFGFPFYYVNEDEARVLARRVLDDLGEPYGVEEGRPMADARRQTLVCTPNPCRGSAVLHWDGDMTRFRRGIGIVSPEPIMSLRVYDASGRVVLHSSLDISYSS